MVNALLHDQLLCFHTLSDPNDFQAQKFYMLDIVQQFGLASISTHTESLEKHNGLLPKTSPTLIELIDIQFFNVKF